MHLGDAIAEILKREGTDLLFGYPVNRLFEHSARKGIRPIIVRQERTGLHMADAIARTTSGKKIGVFAMQHGPGTENAYGAIAQAYSESVPVLVLPTNRRIRFIETSRDVIHSFWVPDLLFKRDVIPGYQNKLEVTKITTEGAYVGRCAELCGTYHSMMNFELRAVSPEKYDQFIKLRQQGLTTPQALEKIGEEPYAVTTKPFDTNRTVRTGG